MVLVHINQHCPYVYFDCFRSTRALHRGNQWPMASPAPAGRNHFWFKISYFAIWYLLYSFSLYPLRGTWQVQNQPLFILFAPLYLSSLSECVFVGCPSTTMRRPSSTTATARTGRRGGRRRWRTSSPSTPRRRRMKRWYRDDHAKVHI